MKFAAREHRLEEIPRVHCTVGLTRADDRMQFVQEEHDRALRTCDVLENRFEALFELTTILGTGDQRAHVERNDALVFQTFGDVAAHDALREAFDDCGLADAGVADEHGIVFGAAREHLDDAANFVVASDHRIEFSAFGFEREIAPVPFERFVRAFGILAGHALIATHVAQRGEQFVLGDPGVAEQRSDGAAGLRHRKEHVFDRRVIVLQRARFALGRVHHARKLAGNRYLRVLGARTREPREVRDRVVDALGEGLGFDAGFGENVGSDAPLLFEQRGEHVLGHRLSVMFVERPRIGLIEAVRYALGHLIYVHMASPKIDHALATVAGQTFSAQCAKTNPLTSLPIYDSLLM